MPIWKLEPIATAISDDAWAFSRWFGSALIRAKTPKQARKIAAEAFRSREGKGRKKKTPLTSPWLDDALVACSRVPVSTFRPDGQDQILLPHVIEEFIS